MDSYQKSIRFGITMILCALVFRLYTDGYFMKAAQWIARPDVTAFLIYLETGQDVRSSFSPKAEPVFAPESAVSLFPEVPETEPEPETQPEPEPPAPVFTESDAGSLTLHYMGTRRPDLAALLTRPLSWTAAPGQPEVLILHTHTTESYTRKGESYREISDFRTLDEQYNMISVGDRVAEILEAGGITVIHDRTLHDHPSYNGSYVHARAAVKAILEANPTIRLVLDLHRDAADSGSGQLRTRAAVDGLPCAQLMLVMGTDEAGLTHPNWEQNVSLALKLQVLLERSVPGITRPPVLRSQRFNQDLSPGMLLVEVGAAGNSHDEALLAADVLGDTLLTLLSLDQIPPA